MKWTKEIIKEQLIDIKSRDGHIHYSHLQRHYNNLRAAMQRLFNNYSEALIYAGFDPIAEKGEVGSGFRGKHHTAATKRLLSSQRKGHNIGSLNPMYGQSHTQETCNLISKKLKESHTLNPGFQSGPKNHMFGKRQSVESNEKRSESLKKYNSQFDKRPYKLTEEGKKSIQNGRAIALSQQKSKWTDIEQKIATALNEMDINYEFQFPFKYFVVDFFLPAYNTVIWCDGDYWHGNPATCPQLTKQQMDRCRIDHSQESFLKNRNINFLRFWGYDINHDINSCKQKILQLIEGDK